MPSAEQASSGNIVNPNLRGCYGEESQEGKKGDESEKDREEKEEGRQEEEVDL